MEFMRAFFGLRPAPSTPKPVPQIAVDVIAVSWCEIWAHVRDKATKKEYAMVYHFPGSEFYKEGDLFAWNQEYQNKVYERNPTFSKAKLDEVYEDRGNAVQLAAEYARRAGFDAGIREGTQSDRWPVVAMNTPLGEVAWHINEREIVHKRDRSDPIFGGAYDGHTNEQKRQRIHEFIAS